jgi:hypothetical protein
MNGTVRAVLTSKSKRTFLCMRLSNFMLRYAMGKIGVKNTKLFDKKWRFSLILRYFLER